MPYHRNTASSVSPGSHLRNTIVSLPLVVVFLTGVASSIPDAFAAKFGFAVGVVAIIGGQFLRFLQLHLAQGFL